MIKLRFYSFNKKNKTLTFSFDIVDSRYCMMTFKYQGLARSATSLNQSLARSAIKAKHGVRQALICFKRTLRFSKGYFQKISIKIFNYLSDKY